MQNQQDFNTLFREAVAAIDTGNVVSLERLIAEEPRLVSDRLESPGAWLREKVGRVIEPGEFFERPYLLWFVAEDPVRNGRLPRNIADVARTIIRAAANAGADCPPLTSAGADVHGLQHQLDYALRLVSLSWIARQCNVQIELIDVLIDAGASPDGHPDHALVNGNFAAAEHLVNRGAALTLATAFCVGRWDDVPRLMEASGDRHRRFAFVLAALNGKSDALRLLIDNGIKLNRPSEDLFSHGTALHHAVCSGSLDAVKVLVEAGADLTKKDTAWNATPLEWAEHCLREAKGEDSGKQHNAIAAYLREEASKR